MATGTTASNDKSVMNPLLAPSDAQDQLPGFPQILRSPFPHPHGVPGQLTPPVGAVSPGGGPLPPHPLGGLPPMMPPLHPLPGLPPPGLAGIRPPRLDGPLPMGIPPMMLPNFPIPSPSSQAGGPILLTPPPRMGLPPSSSQQPLLMTPPTTDASMPSNNSDGSPNQWNEDERPSISDKMGEPREVWVEHKTADGNFYYSDPKTRKTTWEKPKDVKIIQFALPTSVLPTTASTEGGMLPTSGPPGSGGIPGLPPGVPLIPQRVWSEHDNPEGRVYYYNKVTRQSVWDKPKDLELIMPLPADLAGPQMTMPTLLDNSHQRNVHVSDGINQSHQPLLSINSPLVIPHIPPSLLSTGPPLQNIERQMEEEPQMDSKELLALVASKLGTGPSNLPINFSKPINSLLDAAEVTKGIGPRPTISVPVPGTPWSVVYTNDEKMFFFDATSRKSFWDLPPELENNPQVYKIIENPPWKKKRVGAVEEPASKRIKLDDDGDNVKEDKETMEVEEGPAAIVIPSTVESKKKESSVVSREAKMAQLRATLPFDERQQSFKAMLLERQVSAFSTWDKELPKFIFDDRFHLLLAKERKTAFDEFVLTRTEEEMKEKKQKIREKKEIFQSLLREAKITKKTTFSEFCRMYNKDERFKAIEKMRERESMFQERIMELKKINRQKGEDQKMAQKSKIEKVKNDFFSMLSEASKLTPNSQWKKVKGIFQKDGRYQAVDGSSQREEYYNEYLKQLGKDDKQERVQASLREREREVELSRIAQREQWEKDRGQLKRTEAETTFGSILADLVKDPMTSWSGLKKNLRRDHRWDMCETIELEEKETMFKNHISKLEEKRRLQFRKLLEETSKITLKMAWKKARKLIKEDHRYKKYSDSDEQRESEYGRYLRDRLVQSKNEFKSLLKETKLINYKTKGMIHESEKHLKDIINNLEKDQRYLILECIKNEREEILMDYIDDLQKRGPPPPPTATHPSERLRK